MDFTKNEKLIINPFQVHIKSAYHNNVIPSFSKLYSTPSKIDFQNTSNFTSSGVVYANSIKLVYPGIKPLDFLNFNNLVHDSYYVDITTDQNERIRVGKLNSEMKIKTSYTIEGGFVISFNNQSLDPLQYLGPDLIFPGASIDNLTQSFPYTFTLTL